MSYPIRATIAAIAIAAPLTLAQAQSTPTISPATPPPMAPMPAPGSAAGAMPGMDMGKMMGGDMGQMMRMMHGGMMPGGMMPAQAAGMMPFNHVEGRIAFYKAELAITDAQLPQWNAFAEAMRAGAKDMQASMAAMMQTGMMQTGMMHAGMAAAAPARADAMVQMMSARLDAMKAIVAAAKPLYAVLSDDQKKMADELISERLRGMRAMAMGER
jgi:hypothetical protein